MVLQPRSSRRLARFFQSLFFRPLRLPFRAPWRRREGKPMGPTAREKTLWPGCLAEEIPGRWRP